MLNIVNRFMREGRPRWEELEGLLKEAKTRGMKALGVRGARRQRQTALSMTREIFSENVFVLDPSTITDEREGGNHTVYNLNINHHQPSTNHGDHQQ